MHTEHMDSKSLGILLFKQQIIAHIHYLVLQTAQ